MGPYQRAGEILDFLVFYLVCETLSALLRLAQAQDLTSVNFRLFVDRTIVIDDLVPSNVIICAEPSIEVAGALKERHVEVGDGR